jgi:hypothetical protein
MPVMKPEQIALARHALGLPSSSRRSYRNRFVTGPGSLDYLIWIQMVIDGNARQRNGSALTGGDDFFVLTAAGAIAALKPDERLDQEDFPGIRK